MSRGEILAGTALILLLVSVYCVSGQATAVGAGSVSMAGVSAALEDVWSTNNNPAGLAGYHHISVATSLEQRFLMKELGHYSIGTAYPFRKGCLGLTALFSGYASMINQEISLGCGQSFGNNLLAGISLVYIFQKASHETLPVHRVSYTLGTIARISEKLHLAFAAFNPFQLYFKSADYSTLTSVFKLSLAYRYVPSFIVYTEVEKDLDLPVNCKLGMEYSAGETFKLRAGVSGFPFRTAFGFAFRKERLLIELAADYHQYLGFTPVTNIQYDLK